MCTKNLSGTICDKTQCPKYDPNDKYHCKCFERETQRWEAENLDEEGNYLGDK